MPDYSKSKIYRLDCCDMVYIGSTTQSLAKRKGKHKTDYLLDKGCRSKLLYQYAIDNKLSLTEDIAIELIENCPCDNKEQLSAIEGKYIRQFKSEYGEKCVNKQIAGRRKKEYRDCNKDKIAEQHKEWYADNKDKILQQNKQYYEDNKDIIAQKQKEYYQKKKDKIKDYYADNKDKILQQKKQYYLFKKIDKIFYD
jgi:hypothetical protein